MSLGFVAAPGELATRCCKRLTMFRAVLIIVMGQFSSATRHDATLDYLYLS